VELGPLFLSFRIAAIAIAVSGVVGVALGALLSSRRLPGRDVLDVLVTAPMVMPPTVLGYYALVAIGRKSALGGLVERITGSPLVFTETGAVIAACIGALPLVVKSSRAALESVDPVLVSAARTLVAGLMLGFARALGDFGVTLMVAGDIPGETQTASLAIYDAIQSNREHDALVTIVVLTTVALLLLYVANKLTSTPYGK